LCVIPDGDLFRVLRAGQARMVTDTIAQLTPTGVQLTSGEHLPADILVTATGLRLQFFGGATLTVDGTPRPPGTLVHYKACLFSGVPNFALTMGYTNNSWTLKADLVADYVCRLLETMGARGLAIAVPPEPGLPSTPAMPLQAGYVLRAAGTLTQQADRDPWRVYQDYRRDVDLLGRQPIDDGVLQFPPGPVEWTPAPARLPAIGTDPA
jgi:cation diffusion facilitator CzcD-associated flavoprotein CzcO